MKFIYIFTQEGYDDMVRRGYELLKEDRANGIWVFVNKDPEDMEFSDRNYNAVLSNVVTF